MASDTDGKAQAALNTYRFLSQSSSANRPSAAAIDQPTRERCDRSLSDKPLCLRHGGLQTLDGGHVNQESLFYLAYGSNLSAETFLGRRGIRPLSQVNVVVPSLQLTFDLPGVPYTEPCFANTSMRDSKHEDRETSSRKTYTARSGLAIDEKTPLLGSTQDGCQNFHDATSYHKTRWHKPMVGVLYELTMPDFAHVLATEGGGAAYHDIVVECYPITAKPSPPTVPEHPTNPSVMGHTLFAPAPPPPKNPPGDDPPPDKPPEEGGGRYARPDPNYAQPSARYLKLITDGAQEHDLPREYQDYLAQIRPYRPTTQKQRMGNFLYMTMWGPVLQFVFGLQALFADDKGRNPEWVLRLAGAVFAGIWASYDGYFFNTFGDGERTYGDKPDVLSQPRSSCFSGAGRNIMSEKEAMYSIIV